MTGGELWLLLISLLKYVCRIQIYVYIGAEQTGADDEDDEDEEQEEEERAAKKMTLQTRPGESEIRYRRNRQSGPGRL